MSKRYTTRFEKTLSSLLQDINQGDFVAGEQRLNHLKGHIKAVAGYTVVLQTRLPDDNGQGHKLYFAADINGSLIAREGKIVDLRELDAYGVSSRVFAARGGGERITITHFKTTLFNALLLFPGAAGIADKMMEMDRECQFNSIGADRTLALTLVLSPEATDVHKKIARELVDRKGFKLDDYDEDRVTGQKTTILAMLAQNQNHELLSYMLQNGSYDFNTEYTIYGPPYSRSEGPITPLMLFAYFGDLTAVEMLVSAGVDVNYSVSCNGEQCNALSFARNRMDLVEYLLTNNSECLYTTVGLTDLLISSDPANFIQNMVGYASNLNKLLADRVYYQGATNILDAIGKHSGQLDLDEETKLDLGEEAQLEVIAQLEKLEKDRRKVYQSLDTQESTTQAAEVAQDLGTLQPDYNALTLDSLLLRYFVTKDEGIAEQIRVLCLDSQETALHLVTTLLTDQYLITPDVTELIGNLFHDPKLIHTYFEQRKAITQAKMRTMDSQPSKEEGWQIDDVTIPIEGTIPVKTTMSSNVYIKIADDLIGSVGEGGLSNLAVLKKDSLGRNGIKFRDDLGIITLKTKSLGDDRLVAQGYYKNKVGDILIYFTELRNHTQVENWSRDTYHPTIGDVTTDHSDEQDNEGYTKILGEAEDTSF